MPDRLPVSERAAGSTPTRVHLRLQAAEHYSRTNDQRFNAPAGEFGVCYLAEQLSCAFLETLVRGSAKRLVRRADLDARMATSFELPRPLRLLMLHGAGLVALGLSADVPHRVPYDESQRIALAAWHKDATLDGIEYRCRWDDALFCVALFDRAADGIVRTGECVSLNDLSVIRPILRRYDIGVI
jgi:hypothetical protein